VPLGPLSSSSSETSGEEYSLSSEETLSGSALRAWVLGGERWGGAPGPDGPPADAKPPAPDVPRWRGREGASLQGTRVGREAASRGAMWCRKAH